MKILRYKTLAMRVLSENEYAERARVVFTARVISEENAEFKGYRRVLVSATLNRSGVRELVSSASTVAVVVYSCALRVSEQIYSKPYTHTLELRITVTVKSSKHLLNPLQLLNLLGSALSEVTNYLEREDEARFLKISFENSMFAEDMARLVATRVVLVYSNQLDLEDTVITTMRSFETLHEYDLYVVLKTRSGELVKSSGVLWVFQ